MNWLLFSLLLAACIILMLIERLGAPTTLALNFKGDVKRETRWLAQYGQALCTLVAALLVWRLDNSGHALDKALLIIIAVFTTAIIALLIKRLLGRVRPGRDQAGKFLGPTWKHANFRESFPSSHSASAVALSIILTALYPRGAEIFWSLALICAALRYIMDAHWPSDVCGGIALGYGMAYFIIWAMHSALHLSIDSRGTPF